MGCQAEDWFVNGADQNCQVCGRGPRPLAFNLPVFGEDAEYDTRPIGYGEVVTIGAESRGLRSAVEVASRRVGKTLHILHAAERV